MVFKRPVLLVSLAASLLTGPLAHAEGKISIAQQFGIGYLILDVVRDQQLIEKQGKAQGIEIKVDWNSISGATAMNEALLTGALDVVSAGVPPMLTIWDRTRGKQNVKAIASLGSMPNYLLTNNPAIKTLKDFTDKDRIAVLGSRGRVPVAHVADRDGQGIRQRPLQEIRRHLGQPPASGRHGRADRGPVGNQFALFQPAVPVPGAAEPQRAQSPQFL